jgi:hypothetical protein
MVVSVSAIYGSAIRDKPLKRWDDQPMIWTGEQMAAGHLYAIDGSAGHRFPECSSIIAGNVAHIDQHPIE